MLEALKGERIGQFSIRFRGAAPLKARDPLTMSTEKAWDLTAQRYAGEVDEHVAFLKQGGISLSDVERRILGDLSECRIAVHLQCSHGLDALSLLALGAAEVIGLDLSEAMLAQAKAKSDRLNARARWVRADVLNPPPELLGTADVVYTGKGALPWVRDIGAWASTVSRLLRPGGRLFIYEGHPLNWVWTEEADFHRLDSQRSYFDKEPRANESFPARAVQQHTGPGELSPTAWEYQWGLGEVVTAVIDAGLRIERLEEHPEHYWPAFKRIPTADLNRLPHTFSLLACSTD